MAKIKIKENDSSKLSLSHHQNQESSSWQGIMLGLLILLGATAFGALLGWFIIGFNKESKRLDDDYVDENSLLPEEDYSIQSNDYMENTDVPLSDLRTICAEISNELSDASNLRPNFVGLVTTEQNYVIEKLIPAPTQEQWIVHTDNLNLLRSDEAIISYAITRHYQEAITRLEMLFPGIKLDAQIVPILNNLQAAIRLYYARMISNCVGRTSELRYRMLEKIKFNPEKFNDIPDELHRYAYTSEGRYLNHAVATLNGDICDIWNKGKYCTESQISNDDDNCGVYQPRFWPMTANGGKLTPLPPAAKKYEAFLRNELAEMEKFSETIMEHTGLDKIMLRR